jgi:hypothetical protein
VWRDGEAPSKDYKEAEEGIGTRDKGADSSKGRTWPKDLVII